MADIPPNNPGAPMGAMPPTKKETGKVQPKKETVRINLPPKPTAAPTIKLPTLPPGGPTGASGAPPPPAPPAATTLRSSATPAAQPRTGAAAPAAPTAAPAPRRPAPAPAAAATISPIDKVLAIAAAVVGLAAIGTTVWMLMMLNDALQQ
jgi:hypothetical protein